MVKWSARDWGATVQPHGYGANLINGAPRTSRGRITSGNPKATNVSIAASTAERVSGPEITACSFGQQGASASSRAYTPGSRGDSEAAMHSNSAASLPSKHQQ